MPLPAITPLPGSTVRYRCWEVPKPKAILVLVHGLGAHSGRWDFSAQFFTKQKLACWAIELQGFGDTPGPRGHIDSYQTYYQDLKTLLAHIRSQYPSQKIFLVGESLGGLIAVRFVELNPGLVQGLILMSPAFQSALKFSLGVYLSLPWWLLTHPQHPIPQPFTAAMCTRDEAYQKVMNANPLELRIASAQLLVQALFEQMRAVQNLAFIKIPTLFVLAGKDYLVSPQASQRAFQRMTLADKKLIAYPEMLHALYIDSDRDQVFADMQNWLKERL